MIADAMKVAGFQVLHIMSGSKIVEHPWSSPASVVDGRLVYGPAQE